MKTLVAIPAMDMVQTKFLKSLIALRPFGDVVTSITEGTLVDVARNKLAVHAIENKCDRVLWLDSDMVFPPDLLEAFSKDIDEGRDFVGGLYFSRREPMNPVIYKDIKATEDEKGINPQITVYEDYPRNDIFKVSGIGFGAVLMTTQLLLAVGQTFGSPFERYSGFGEDLSFCLRVNQLGVPMWCDSRVKLGHVGHVEITEETYLKR